MSAMEKAYGGSTPASGPLLAKWEAKDGSAILTFKQAVGGLVAKDRYGYLKGFTLAGADQKFHWARAEIISENQIRVSCAAVPDPAAVRYGWADNPDDANLYDGQGLPASPFRTDKWKGITQK